MLNNLKGIMEANIEKRFEEIEAIFNDSLREKSKATCLLDGLARMSDEDLLLVKRTWNWYRGTKDFELELARTIDELCDRVDKLEKKAIK